MDLCINSNTPLIQRSMPGLSVGVWRIASPRWADALPGRLFVYPYLKGADPPVHRVVPCIPGALEDLRPAAICSAAVCRPTMLCGARLCAAGAPNCWHLPIAEFLVFCNGLRSAVSKLDCTTTIFQYFST